MHESAIILAVSLALAQCSGSVSNPRSAEYPCGPRAHACSVAPLACCWNDQDCGGQPGSGCPEGMCCYSGSTRLGKEPDASASSNTKQWE